MPAAQFSAMVLVYSVRCSVIVHEDVYVFYRFCGYVFRSVAVVIAVCGGVAYVAITVSCCCE